eukprot:8697675-Pyramimonas_sp.AAC.1
MEGFVPAAKLRGEALQVPGRGVENPPWSSGRSSGHFWRSLGGPHGLLCCSRERADTQLGGT